MVILILMLLFGYFVQSRKNYVSFSVGSAISLSSPEKEYEECLLKKQSAGSFAISQIHKSISDFNLYFEEC
jgi:hypothetical protein